jgi:hypothetical protein
MVIPQGSARLAGADEVAIVGVGHNAMLNDQALVARVVQALA